MRRSAVIGAVLVAVVLTGCSDTTGPNSGSEELSPTSTIAAVAAESTTVPTTVPTTVTIAAVAAESTTILTTVTTAAEPDTTQAEATATYDGSGCSYEGPTEFDLDSTVTFAVINQSDTTNMGFAVWSVPEGTTADDILEQGIFVAGVGSPPDPEKGLLEASFGPTAIDSTGILTVTLDKPGQHALNCYDESTDGGDHAIMFTVSDN